MCKENKAHWWLIDEHTEPESKGVCQHCAEERTFCNIPRFLLSTQGYIHRGQSVNLSEVLGGTS